MTLETVKSERDIGIAIVGTGMISEIQAEAIGRVPGARVIGFCGRTRASAELRAAQFGAIACDSVEDLVAHPEVDVASICTPSGSHMEPALVAASAKKHVIVEKPIEITIERTNAIIDACKRNGVTLAAIFPRRLLPSSRLLKTAIESGRFGTIAMADAYIKWYRTQEYYATSGWRGTKQFDGGGALMNQGIHGVDLLQWLMGGVESVTAFVATRSHSIEVEDVAVASVRFRSGALGVIEASTGSWPGDRLRIEISGSHGVVVLEDETIRTWKFRFPTAEDESIRTRFAHREGLSSGGATDPRAIDSEGHRRQFEDLVSAIRENRAPMIDGAEGRFAVAVVTSIYLSAQESRVVRVPV